MRKCLYCSRSLAREAKYCSNQCQANRTYLLYIKRWQAGGEHGNRGVAAKNVSGHIRRYIQEKYEYACSMCGWNKLHPKTGKSPLEIDHIDGDSENSAEENLRLLCPNCHSLTDSYRNFNKGNGRQWRKAKYLKSN